VREKDEVRRSGSKEVTKRHSADRTVGVPPTPRFFVNIASKKVSSAVSLLFAILAGRSISVAAKGLMQANGWREDSLVRSRDFEGD
jgi:hypothetical protein